MLISEDNFNILYNVLYGSSFLIALLAILKLHQDPKSAVTNMFLSKISVIVIFAFFLLVGFRDYNVGTDTVSYYYYNWILDAKSPFSLEILFDLIIKVVKDLDLSFTVFLLFISGLFYYNIRKSFRYFSKVFQINIFFLFFVFISLFFARSLAINVIRQGLSLSFLLLAYSCWLTNKSFFVWLTLLVVSVITHSTAIIAIVIFFLAFFMKRKLNLSLLIIIYFGSVILAFLDIGILTFAPFLSGFMDSGSNRVAYLTDKTDLYTTGFKPQFVVFNSVFLSLSWYALTSILKKDVLLYYNYRIIFFYYLISSVIFYMTFQIPYSDRFGLFSWIAIPLLISPYLSYEKISVRYKIPIIIFFLFIYIFFAWYGN